MKYLILFIALIAAIGAWILSLKNDNTNLLNYLPENLGDSNLEFYYQNLFSGCEVAVYSINVNSNNSDNFFETVGNISGDEVKKFSPWLQNIDDIMYKEAYFYTLDFDDCHRAVSDRYDENYKNFTSQNDRYFMVGGLVPYKISLSHANVILIAKIGSNQLKIIIFKGGN